MSPTQKEVTAVEIWWLHLYHRLPPNFTPNPKCPRVTPPHRCPLHHSYSRTQYTHVFLVKTSDPQERPLEYPRGLFSEGRFSGERRGSRSTPGRPSPTTNRDFLLPVNVVESYSDYKTPFTPEYRVSLIGTSGRDSPQWKGESVGTPVRLVNWSSTWPPVTWHHPGYTRSVYPDDPSTGVPVRLRPVLIPFTVEVWVRGVCRTVSSDQTGRTRVMNWLPVGCNR